MEDEHRLPVLLRCGQADALRFRATSRAGAAAVRAALSELVLEKCGIGGAPEGRAPCWAAAAALLKALPNVRRLGLRGARLTGEELGALLCAAPAVVECDVSLALPLEWPSYSALRVEPWLSGVRFIDSLGLEPGPALTPREVVSVQAYGLHCRRVDVCFRFASPANRAATGPLERFATFFEGSSRYSVMLGCQSFSVGEQEVHILKGKSSVSIMFEESGTARQLHFIWQLSRQGPGSVEGCWMTDGVVPLEIEALWDGSLLDE